MRHLPRSAAIVVLLSIVTLGQSLAGPTGDSRQANTSVMDVDGNRIRDDFDVLLHDSDQDVFGAIVILREVPTPEVLLQLEKRVGSFDVTSYKTTPGDGEGRSWDIIPGFAAMFTRAQIEAMAELSVVGLIEPVLPIRLFMDTARDESGVIKARSDFSVDGDRTGSQRTWTKDDVVICVIDTGHDDDHLDLNEGQTIAWKDFVNNTPEPTPSGGHGTMVTAIAAGQGDGNSAYVGVAPGAAIVGVKVETTDHIVSAFNWCKDNKDVYGIEIITVSVGQSLPTCADGEDAMSLAATAAWDAGLVVTVAAGNEGPSTCTTAMPGAARKVVTVGAMGDPDNAGCGEGQTAWPGNGWYLWTKSSRGPTGDARIKPDIAAPGVCITSAKAGSGSGYLTDSGTSYATPFVAGVAALMIDAKPTLTPDQLKSLLYNTTEDWGSNHAFSEPESYDYGAGRLQAHDAVEAACDCGAYTGPDNPSHFHFRENVPVSALYDKFSLTVTSTSRSVSITLLNMDNAVNYDVCLKSPNQDLIESSIKVTRQDTISRLVDSYGTGTYSIIVERKTGVGDYALDVSAAASGLVLTTDDGTGAQCL